MGYSATLGIGCTIGAFFSAVSSLSLSGWVFGISLALGAFIGTKIIKIIGWIMNISTEINLVGKSVKKQLLEVEKILNSFSKEEKILLITNEEILVKYIPPKALSKKISVKIKIVENLWQIKLVKE